MKLHIKILILLIFFTALSSAQHVTPFKKKDRVVFVGNSITEAGYYHSYIWLYYMTRFPNMPIDIIGAGVGGDSSKQMYRRLEGDILVHQPNVLITTFGMNDSGYFEYNYDGAETFADGKVKESLGWYKKIEEEYKQLSKTNIVLMGSSPYDETVVLENNTAFKNKNKAMLRIVDFQKQSAEINGWEFLDLNVPMSKINEDNQKLNPSFTICGDDRIHPDNHGHMIMAYLFLKAQGFSGKEVAVTKIDASTKTVLQAKNCKISKLKKNDNNISFNYLAKALPYPMDTIVRGWGQKHPQAEAKKIIPFMEEMNKELLSVSGLSGRYSLFIDDEEVGEWTAEELAQGINLADCERAPQYQQAMKVMFLNAERLELERRFREYAWLQYEVFYEEDMLFVNNRKSLEILDTRLDNGWVRGRRDLYTKAMSKEIRDVWQGQIDLIVSTIYKINKPVKRTVKLIKIA